MIRLITPTAACNVLSARSTFALRKLLDLQVRNLSGSKIPTTHKGLLFEKYKGPLKIVDLPTPKPKDDELLVKIQYSGICHTDMIVWQGNMPDATKENLVGGHEGAGEILSVGSDCKGWKVGDKVGIKLFNHNCLNCEFCKKGYEPCCPHKTAVGMSTNGTFQEYMTVRGVDGVKIDKSTPLDKAAPVLCAGVTVYKALKESNVEPGQLIAMNGAGGGLGSLAIQYAKAMGMRVIAIDHPSKEEHCKKMGAEFFIDGFQDGDIVDYILKQTDGGPHGVISLANARKPVEQAIEYVRKQGTVVLVGLPKDPTVSFDSTPFVFNAITVKGSIVGNRLDADEAMDFVTRGVVDIPIEIIKLEDVPLVYEKMMKGTMTSRAVIDFSL